MTNDVRVPVSADTSSLVREMDAFVSAINRAGQAGRAFNEIDFGHPELEKFADRLLEAQRRFDALKASGQGPVAREIQESRTTNVVDWWKSQPAKRPESTGYVVHTLLGDDVTRPPEPPTPPEKKPKEYPPQPPGIDPDADIRRAGFGAQMRWQVPEFEKYATAIRKAHQEGLKFQQLDFSHPEMKDLKEEFEEAQMRFDEMVRTGRSEAARELRTGIRSGKYDDLPTWLQNIQNQIPNQSLRDRHIKFVSDSITGRGGEEPGEDRPGAGGLPPIMKGMLRYALPLMGLAKIGTMAMEGIGNASQEATAISDFRRNIGDLSGDFVRFREHVRATGEELGVTLNETVRLNQTFARASAEFETRKITEGTHIAIGLARSMGLDPNMASGVMGKGMMLQAAGQNSQARELAMLFANAVAGGKMFSRSDEVMQAITSWVEQSERVMVGSPNTAGYAGWQAAMNESRQPGLMGEMGAGVLSRADAAIRAGGGAGEAGKNFLYRLLTQSGGFMSPFRVQYGLEEGAFGKMKDGSTVLESVIEKLKGYGPYAGNDYMRWSAGGNLLGLSMHQYSALEKLKPQQISGLNEMSKKYGFDVNKLDAAAITDIANLSRMGESELDAYRHKLLVDRKGELSEAQIKSLSRGDLNVDELRKTLIQTVSGIGMEKDLGQEVRQSAADIANEIQKMSEKLVPPLVIMKQATSGIFKLMADSTGQQHYYTRKMDEGRDWLYDKVPQLRRFEPSGDKTDAFYKEHGIDRYSNDEPGLPDNFKSPGAMAVPRSPLGDYPVPDLPKTPERPIKVVSEFAPLEINLMLNGERVSTGQIMPVPRPPQPQ